MKLLSHGRKRLVFQGLLLSLLAACAAVPSREPTEGGFLMRGKLGVAYPADSFSARFLWQQRRDGFAIDLWGPLGQGRVQLVGDARALELRQGDGTLVDRGPAEQVMLRHLGWSLPLSVLPQWARGRPAGSHPVSARQRDEAGRLAAFEQLGWSVELDRYQAVAANPPAAGAQVPDTAGTFLPHRITATRGDYRVRLAVSGWEF